MRKKKREGLWQWDFRNRKTNFGNSIDENVEKKKNICGNQNFSHISAKCEKKKEKKKENYGNRIAEIGGNCFPPISAIPLP